MPRPYLPLLLPAEVSALLKVVCVVNNFNCFALYRFGSAMYHASYAQCVQLSLLICCRSAFACALLYLFYCLVILIKNFPLYAADNAKWQRRPVCPSFCLVFVLASRQPPTTPAKTTRAEEKAEADELLVACSLHAHKQAVCVCACGMPLRLVDASPLSLSLSRLASSTFAIFMLLRAY